MAAGKDSPWELYDLAHDRAESNNLAAQQPEQVRELADLWQARDRKIPGPGPRPIIATRGCTLPSTAAHRVQSRRATPEHLPPGSAAAGKNVRNLLTPGDRS